MRETDPVGRLTRIAAWLALVLEVIGFAAKPLHLAILEPIHDGLEQFGVLLFLISLVSWLEASNKGLAKLDRMADELNALTEEAKKIDIIARYGSSAVSLARLLNPQGQDVSRYPHCRAGGETLSHLLLNTYTQAAEAFHKFRSGERDDVKLAESSIINLFLRNLVESLPAGSVWLGTSRLQDSGAWEEGTAEPDYYEFERAVETQISRKHLTYLRVLCFETEVHHQQMLHIANHQRERGLNVRAYIKKEMPNRELPKDMSLIWVPTIRMDAKIDLDDPIGYLEKHSTKYEPLYGLSFGIRADREVNTMNLVRPEAQGFSDLKIAFRRSWTNARRDGLGLAS